MNIGFETAIVILFIFIFLDILFSILIIFKKTGIIKKKQVEDKFISELINNYELLNRKLSSKEKDLLIEKYIELNQSVEINNNELQKKILKFILDKDLEIKYIKKLKSFFKSSRIEAASILGNIPCTKSRISLEIALIREKNLTVKLSIINALINIGKEDSIPIITDVLPDSPEWFREKVSMMLYEFKELFYKYALSLLNDERSEIELLIIHFAAQYVSPELKKYLLEKTDSSKTEISHAAFDALSKLYFTELDNETYLNINDNYIKSVVIKSISMINDREHLDKLLKILGNPDTQEYVIYAISTMVRKEPKHLKYLIEYFHTETDESTKGALAKILSNRIEYFLVNILSREKNQIKDLAREILEMNKTSEIIGFLNKNKNIEIENEILSVVKKVITTNTFVKDEFELYVNEKVLKKLNLEHKDVVKEKREEKREKSKLIFLWIMLVSIIMVFPFIFLVRHYNELFTTNAVELIKIYVLDFNYYLVYYSTSINLLYLFILALSFIGVYYQSRNWRFKKMSFLFKKNILPSISIIAPAYCEEATIIESTNSLLNLKYPNYELIVVNDGSSDQTLNTLINYYNLEKVDFLFENKLKTKPVRGIYLNKSMPKFLVVDKANGGKADSLNAGINISRKDFFCGIDADSLLEPEALLKAASLILDSENETVAVGGNIFPINGCSVDKGYLYDIKLPSNWIARSQTIEYIRAFMAGRIGWAFLNCLLIISGAFGLFNKNRIIEIGGYLTSSERFKKDTVGEDMELVVRLSSMMREKKLKYNVGYAYNANCWTEVPEDMNILYRQRDRWHRGLIDILTFHRRTLFNPKYGSMGIISMPYFFIFEMAGPMVEIQGYIMVILAAILGLLNGYIFLLLFISTIMMGTFISLSSLLIAEKDSNYFSLKETAILIEYSIMENFGLRQMISFWRVTGFFNSMKKPKGWGKMVRKGFAKK